VAADEAVLNNVQKNPPKKILKKQLDEAKLNEGQKNMGFFEYFFFATCTCPPEPVALVLFNPEVSVILGKTNGFAPKACDVSQFNIETRNVPGVICKATQPKYKNIIIFVNENSEKI
jgi:hypothetical protein